MFQVFSTGSQELKVNFLPILYRDNHISRQDGPNKTTPIKSSATKRDLEFAKMEAIILMSQALCTKISNHMGWIKEEKIFLCWRIKVQDNALVNELTRLQNQLLWMKTLLINIKSWNIIFVLHLSPVIIVHNHCSHFQF